MNVTLRAGKPEDAVRCGVICYEAFKTISEYPQFPARLSDTRHCDRIVVDSTFAK
jgi:hypothetical protein